jgi:S1-C subfamily serine protease
MGSDSNSGAFMLVAALCVLIFSIVSSAIAKRESDTDENDDEGETVNETQVVTNTEKSYKYIPTESEISDDLASNDANIKGLIEFATCACVTIYGTHDRYESYSGSGFLVNIKDTVVIATVAHVVLGATQLGVYYTNTSGESFMTHSKLIGVSYNADLALCTFNKSESDTGDVNTLSINTESCAIGETVLLMGTPMGVERNSSSIGRVKDNDFTDSDGFSDAKNICIQTCATPGNSGGPIINKFGQCVGICSWGFKNYSTFAFGASGHSMSIIFADIWKTRSDFIGKVFKDVDLGTFTNEELLNLVFNKKFNLPITKGDSTQLWIDRTRKNIAYYINKKSHIYTSSNLSIKAEQVNLSTGKTNTVTLFLIDEQSETSTNQQSSNISTTSKYDSLIRYHSQQ